MRKIISILLAMTLAFTLLACGSEETNENGTADGGTVAGPTSATVANDDSSTDTEVSEDDGIWYLGKQAYENEATASSLFSSVTDIDVDAIYSSTTYSTDMFYGAYTLNNEESDIANVRSSYALSDIEFSAGAKSVVSLPIAIYAGTDYLSSNGAGFGYSDYKAVTDKDVAVLKFAGQSDTTSTICTYEISGNKITYTEIVKAQTGNTYQKGSAVFEYEFSVKGPNFTLSNADGSITLKSYCFIDSKLNDLTMSAYSLPQTPLVDNMDYANVSRNVLNYAVMRDGTYYDDIEVKVCDDGHITFYLTYKDADGKDQVITKQYAYIAQSSNLTVDDFRVVLLDGNNTCFYTDTLSSREARNLSGDGLNVNSLTEEALKEIAEKKSDLFDDLYNEFKAKGINVTINRSTGEMAMDASVLFGGDSAEITSDGKALIDKFLAAYTSIAFGSKYDGFITKTIVEGHTAPLKNSTYESGLSLSEERANNVKNYCLSGASGADVSKLKTTLEAVGCSNSKPVYGSDGEVDLDACRRVSFRFIVNSEAN